MSSFETQPLVYGPPTLQESLEKAMIEKAQAASRTFDRYEVALLAEALGEVGMTLMDLSLQQLNRLSDIEADIETYYGLSELAEQTEEDDE